MYRRETIPASSANSSSYSAKLNRRGIGKPQVRIGDFKGALLSTLIIISLMVPAISLLYMSRASAEPSSDPPINIHLTWGQNDTSHTIAVTWKTATAGAGDNVLYDIVPRGGVPENYAYSATGSYHTYSGAGGYLHDVELTGLSPNTRYYLICGGENGGYSAERSFRTAPDQPTSFRLVAGGDPRSGATDWPKGRDNVSRAMASLSPSFVLFIGDFAYNWNNQNEWDNWFAAEQLYWVDENGLTIPIIPSIGNHEIRYPQPSNYDPGGDATNYYGQFYLPGNERWYSLDWGPDLHVVVLDSEILDNGSNTWNTQLAWLENDLSANASRMWKIVIFHRPPYSSGPHGSNSAIRQAWGPIFDNYHVDLVVNGHDHLYERTYPIYENTVKSSPSEGTVYIVSGGWGAPLYSGSANWWTAYGPASKYHFLTIDISRKGGLHLRAVDAEGVTFDEYSIHKENYWVEVSISPDENNALPAENLTYTVTLTNVGAFADNYYLTVSDNENWDLTLSENFLENIGPGENRVVTLTVIISGEAIGCTKDNITVTVASMGDNEVSITDSCIAHATPSEAAFSFVTLYKLRLDAKLYLDNGSKLVVKFHTYGDTFENENVFWSGTTPAHVKENENVQHPSGTGVKKARLDLTTDNNENVISTLASFTVRKSNLITRISQIKGRWPFAPPAEKSALISEISGIKSQWPFAPS